MHFYFQYLSTRSGKALLLFFDKKRYIFNCFEGFQRYSIEKGIKLSSLSAIFLCTADAIPPLIGTYLTIGDSGKSEICIVGTPRHKQIFEHAKAFAYRRSLKYRFCGEYKDEIVSVSMLDISGECTYVVSLPTIRGRLMVDKLPKALPKVLYSQICKRQKVVFGGTTYDGSNFLEEDVCPERVAIVYSTQNYGVVKERLENLSVGVFIVFHRSCAEYLKTHIGGTFYVLEDSCFVEFTSFYAAQVKANKVDGNYIVPSPASVCAHAPSSCKEAGPRTGFLHSGDIISFCKSGNEYRTLRSEQVPYSPTQKLHNKTPALLFLGTGCAMPSKYRNVASVLVQAKTTSYLLDCGEDTLYQMHRALGSFDAIKSLSFIFISHAHADHHLGLVSVLRQCLVQGVQIRVFAPSSIRAFVGAFFDNAFFDFHETDRAVALREAFRRSHATESALRDFVLTFDFGYRLSVCGVSHSIDGCGALVNTDLLSVAYSGDTMPDLLFQTMAGKCDVLVHEATFDDGLEDRAKATKHSTVGDALGVWRHSGAKKLVLTHLSQRHKSYSLCDTNVTLASDLQRYLPEEEEDLDKKRLVCKILRAAFSSESCAE